MRDIKTWVIIGVVIIGVLAFSVISFLNKQTEESAMVTNAAVNLLRSL